MIVRLVTLTVVLSVVLAGCASAPTDPAAGSMREYVFWPSFPAEPRVQFLTTYRYSSDIEPQRSGLNELVFGKQSQVLPINKPYGVAMRDGKIYVCDIRNQGVIVLDVPRQETRLLGITGMARMATPTDICFDDEGFMYVSDVGRGVIFVFDANERHVNSFGFTGLQPTGLDVHGNELFVADFGGQKMHVLDKRTGEQLRSWGEAGMEDGKFIRPLGVAVGSDGNIYTCDVMRCRVQKFSPEGELLDAFGDVGQMMGDFVRPKHMAVDADGIIYVVDSAFNNVQMFNTNHELLMFFGARGAHGGAMYLPAGIDVNQESIRYFEHLVHPGFEAQRLIIVSNQFGAQKVSVYAMGELRPGVTPQDLADVATEIETGVSEEGPRESLLPPGVPPEEGSPEDATDDPGSPPTESGTPDGGTP